MLHHQSQSESQHMFKLMYLNRIDNNDDNFIYIAPLNGYKEHHNKSM